MRTLVLALYLLLILSLLLLFLSLTCQSQAPRNTVKAFLDAISEGKMEQARAYYDPVTGGGILREIQEPKLIAVMHQAQLRLQWSDLPSLDPEAQTIIVQADSAEGTYRMYFYLVKKEGRWYIQSYRVTD